ncbi:hypothetical protein D1BOALGB6SA_964 [Olavius sp. associated proteobacterium Delta 1]|nr:hypothetical protein D1BOALGB6SA_964 [Olavius sp. associated proteobacterium Delta 1]
MKMRAMIHGSSEEVNIENGTNGHGPAGGEPCSGDQFYPIIIRPSHRYCDGC